MTSCDNFTLVNVDSRHVDDQASVEQTITGLVIFFVSLPFVLFEARALPLGTTVSALLASTLMVLARVVPQDEVYDVITRQHYTRFMLMLLSVMIFAGYLSKEQLFIKLVERTLRADQRLWNYVLRVSILTCVASALFTSDAACAVLTPVILRQWQVHDRCESELHTIVLTLTTSANIGSALSVFGSLPMALIASTTSRDVYSKSQLNARTCLLYLGPCVALVLTLNIVFLTAHHKIKNCLSSSNARLMSHASQSDQELTTFTSLGTASPSNGHARGVAESEHEDKTEMYSNGQSPSSGNDECLFHEGGSGGYRDVTTSPCALETILEDEILEINSDGPSGRSLTSLRALSGADVSCDLSAIDSITADSADSEEDIDKINAKYDCRDEATILDEDVRTSREQSSELLSSDDVIYVPSALSTRQNLLTESNNNLNENSHNQLTSHLEKHGYLLSKTLGIYRSFSGISGVEFCWNEVTQRRQITERNDSKASKLFRLICCVLLMWLAAHNLLSSGWLFSTDLGE